MSKVIVLDTHIWFWWINLEHQRIPLTISAEIENASNIAVSPVSCFELALAYQKRRVELPLPVLQWLPLALAGSNVDLLPLTPTIAARAVQLTDIHRDPFDRIIIATALEYNAGLASIDRHFAEYPELVGSLLK